VNLLSRLSRARETTLEAEKAVEFAEDSYACARIDFVFGDIGLDEYTAVKSALEQVLSIAADLGVAQVLS
jgi:hypothetical protein